MATGTKTPELPESLHVTVAAALLGVSVRRIRQLATGEGVLVVESGQVTFSSLCAQIAGRAATAENEGDYEADKAREMKAKADIAEIEAAKAAGAVVLSRTVERTIEHAISAVKEKLDGVGPSIAARVMLCKKQREVSEMITEGNRAAMQSLLDMDFKRQPAATEDDAADEE
jgi:hypothetical protein